MFVSIAASIEANSINSLTIRSGFQDWMIERSPGKAARALIPAKILHTAVRKTSSRGMLAKDREISLTALSPG